MKTEKNSKEMTLRLKLNTKTLKFLRDGNYNLTIYKGVKSSNESISSTVWCSVSAKKLLENNTFTWSNEFQAFISNKSVASGIKIKASTARHIDLGDKFTINDGTVKVTYDGTENKILTVNDGHSFTTGLSVRAPGSNQELYRPIFVVTMPGRSSLTITPKEKLLVAFTTSSSKKLSMPVSEIHTAAATIEYFDEIDSHEISYDFDSGIWEGIDTNDDTENSRWFRFLRRGVHHLNRVLNG